MERALALEPLRADNAAELAALLGEPASEWERRAARWPAWRNWIVRVDGDAVGYVQATAGDQATEVAWVIGGRWRGRGYATRAAQAMIGELGCEPVIAHIDPANTVSEGVARKLGLHPTGEWSQGEQRWAFRPPGLSSSALRATSHSVQGGEDRP